MNIVKKICTALLALGLTFALVGCGQKDATAAQGDGPTVVKLGVVGENNEQWAPVIERLKADDIDLQLVKFSAYPLPNQALADKEIDLNAFQHYAYLEKEVLEKKLDLSVIADTIIAPLGLYSDKYTSIDQLPDGARISIPSDATNGGRSLKVLEMAGLIVVDPAAGFVPELKDITQNPKNIKFIEMEAAQLPSVLPDVDASIINGGHAVDAGLTPDQDAIYLESASHDSGNPYINVLVARTEDKDNPIYKKIIGYYQSDEVEQVLVDAYKGAFLPAWK